MVITGQPPSSVFLQTTGSSTALTVQAADRNGGALTYQWKRGTFKDPNNAVNISGATSSTYYPPTGTASSTSYFCRVATVASNGRIGRVRWCFPHHSAALDGGAEQRSTSA